MDKWRSGDFSIKTWCIPLEAFTSKYTEKHNGCIVLSLVTYKHSQDDFREILLLVMLQPFGSAPLKIKAHWPQRLIVAKPAKFIINTVLCIH